MAYPLALLFENLLAPPLVFLLSHQLTHCQREAVVRTYLAPLGCSPLRPANRLVSHLVSNPHPHPHPSPGTSSLLVFMSPHL